MGRRGGFSLIELLVSISIIASLLAILIPSLSGARKDANVVLCANNLRTVASGASLYAMDNNDWLPLSPQYFDGDEHPEVSATVVRMEGYDLVEMMELYFQENALVCPSASKIPISHPDNSDECVNTNYLFLWGTIYEAPGRVPPRLNARSDYIIAADFFWYDYNMEIQDHRYGGNHTNKGKLFALGTVFGLSPETSPSAMQYLGKTSSVFAGINGAKLDGSVGWYQTKGKEITQGGPFNPVSNPNSCALLPHNPPWDRK